MVNNQNALRVKYFFIGLASATMIALAYMKTTQMPPTGPKYTIIHHHPPSSGRHTLQARAKINAKDSPALRFNSEQATPKKRLPQVICIGVKKCGTSALKSFLSKHPKVKVPLVSEPHFFDNNSSFLKGDTFYRSMMSPSLDDEVTMEKTPKYFVTEWVPMKMVEFFQSRTQLPKLIVVLCNPVDRFFSEFVHIQQSEGPNSILDKISGYGTLSNLTRSLLYTMRTYIRSRSWKSPESMEFRSNSSFIKYIRKHQDLTLITNGFYYMHLKRWLLYFRRDQILVLNGERLLRTPWLVLEKVQDFIGVPRVITRDSFVYQEDTGFFCVGKCPGPSKGRTRSLSGNKDVPALTVKNRQLLGRYYAPMNAALYRLIGEDFNW